VESCAAADLAAASVARYGEIKDRGEL